MSGESYRRQGRKNEWRRTASFAQPTKALGTDRAYAFATCDGCGKHGYMSKQQAKRAAKSLYPGQRMRVYQCGALWHMTSHDAATAAQYRERQAARGDG